MYSVCDQTMWSALDDFIFSKKLYKIPVGPILILSIRLFHCVGVKVKNFSQESLGIAAMWFMVDLIGHLVQASLHGVLFSVV